MTEWEKRRQDVGEELIMEERKKQRSKGGG